MQCVMFGCFWRKYHGPYRVNCFDGTPCAEHVITNSELTARFAWLGRSTVIDRLEASTGITKRFHVPDHWVTSDLALPAAKEALRRAGRKREDVDLIILGTTSPDYVTPDTAVVLQYKLGAKNAGTFDVGCACAAFPPMIAIGSGLTPPMQP
jgi:3-oxoacyl-[acyl-carrier-protein] synthase III